MRKRAGLRKNENLLQQVRLRSAHEHEPFSQQIEQLLRQELANESGTEAEALRRKANKPKAETHKGNILIINDAPIENWLVRWFTAKRYQCTLVNSDDEADALLEHGGFDSIVYSHEFLYPHSVPTR